MPEIFAIGKRLAARRGGLSSKWQTQSYLSGNSVYNIFPGWKEL
jgi:hypothetical protein